jgi:hypothetical protein
MWKIEITPSKIAGDGYIRLAETSKPPFARVVEDYRQVQITAEAPEELLKALISYALVTGKLTREDIREYLEISAYAPAGSENWSLEQWEAYKPVVDAAMAKVKANPEKFRVGPDGKTPYEHEQAVKIMLGEEK